LLVIVGWAVVFGMGPTVGDIGSCGQSAADLDAATFFAVKNAIDCRRCGDCRLRAKSCDRACAPRSAPTTFPQGCGPLVHDGEVCLRALLVASCDDYTAFQDDLSPTSPSECQFCPVP
jgi:hypothetical protein